MKRRWKLWYLRFEFVPQDLWVGLYWRVSDWEAATPSELDIWICLFPTIPLHIRLKDFSQEETL